MKSTSAQKFQISRPKFFKPENARQIFLNKNGPVSVSRPKSKFTGLLMIFLKNNFPFFWWTGMGQISSSGSCPPQQHAQRSQIIHRERQLRAQEYSKCPKNIFKKNPHPPRNAKIEGSRFEFSCINLKIN